MANNTRSSAFSRKTAETSITLEINLDGNGTSSVFTGFGMLDHMLTLLTFWAHFDLSVMCTGDIHIDAHHTTEDIALALGKAFSDALGDKKGIRRTGWARVPMDEALADVTVDLSGRSWLEYRGDELLPPIIAKEEKDLWREFFKAFASTAHCNLHISFNYGKNGHHLLESAFKSLGIALSKAITITDNRMPSTKGSLD